MPPQPNPADLSGYRRVPGYGKISFFNPLTGEHRSSRRYYNPLYPTTDPRHEITERQYRNLRAQATAEQRGEASIRQQQRRNRETMRRQQLRANANNRDIPYARAEDVSLQARLLTYETSGMPSFDPQARQIRAPGGPLAKALEELGIRPPDAPWAVGESDSLEQIPSLFNPRVPSSPAMEMAYWRSQTGPGATIV